MKKKLLILVSVLVSAFSYLDAQDTIIVIGNTTQNIPDTVTYGFIFPEVMDDINCYDGGYHDPIIGFAGLVDLSRSACEGKALKSVAQGFKFDEPTAIDGTYNVMGVMNASSQFQVPPAGFKMGVMDSMFNIIYEKEYLIDYDNGNYWGVVCSFTPIPFDSTLYLNDFVYIYFEWPDSCCVGGFSSNTYYQDDEPTMYLGALIEERQSGISLEEGECALCDVKYDPLFKWYGSNSWERLSDLRCELSEYAYWIDKDGDYETLYYPPVGVTLYYTNNNNGDNGGDDNGNNNDDNNEGEGESGLTDIDVSHLVSISPNPADDILKIHSSFKVKEMEIYNALGQVVLRKEGSQNIETIDVSNLQSGTYIVRIKTQRGFATKRVIIK